MASDTRLATCPFDPADYVTDPDDQAKHIADAFGSGNQIYTASALGTVARARGMTVVAKGAGVTREALCRALSPTGDPRPSTLLGVVRALGFQLSITPLVKPDQPD